MTYSPTKARELLEHCDKAGYEYLSHVEALRISQLATELRLALEEIERLKGGHGFRVKASDFVTEGCVFVNDQEVVQGRPLRMGR